MPTAPTQPDDWHDRLCLPHGRPTWLTTDGIFLLTVCGTPRGLNQLCDPRIANAIKNSLKFQQQAGAWLLLACVLMPDHVHLLARVPPSTDLQRTVTSLKRYLARSERIRWQRDFFEHRLRRDEHFEAKLEYLRQNPVRAGLAVHADDWPYFWTW